MGLADRQYMREPDFSSEKSVAVQLIIALVAIFLIQCFLGVYGGIKFDSLFALSLAGFKELHLWQIVTFQFLHAWPWPFHVLFNCLGLYFLGRPVQDALGRRGFLKVYFLAGFVGAVVQLLAMWLLPVYSDKIAVVGASAGVMGLLAAFTTLHPMREACFLFYFFPVTLRAYYVFWFMACLSIFGTFFPFGGTAHAAHLGGLLAGVAYIRWFVQDEQPRWLDRLRSHSFVRRKPVAKVAANRTGRWLRPAPDEEELPPGEFISREVDPILDKISQHGIHSLTDREKKILEKARERMARR